MSLITSLVVRIWCSYCLYLTLISGWELKASASSSSGLSSPEIMTTQHLTGSYIQSSWARKRKERHTHLNRKLSLFSKDLILYTFPWYKLGKKFILSGKKKLACNVGEAGLIPGSGRSTGEVNGNPLQYSCLGNLMDRGVWQAIAHGVTRVGHNLVTKSAPVVSKLVLMSPNSFFYFPLCFIYFHHSIFHFTYPIFCLSYYSVDTLECF